MASYVPDTLPTSGVPFPRTVGKQRLRVRVTFSFSVYILTAVSEAPLRSAYDINESQIFRTGRKLVGV